MLLFFKIFLAFWSLLRLILIYKEVPHYYLVKPTFSDSLFYQRGKNEPKFLPW